MGIVNGLGCLLRPGIHGPGFQRRPELLINYRRFPRTRRPPLSETFDVFFSYNSKDREIVRAVRQALESRGIRVWMDEEQISPGAGWMQQLQELIPRASAAAV